MIQRALSAIVLCCAAFLISADPSIIIIKGRVFTGEPSRPFAEALAIEGNKITAVGTDAEIKAMKGEKTEVIDAQGRLVIPGLNDAHVHVGMAMPSYSVASGLDTTWSDIAAAIASALDETPKDLWLSGILGPALINDSSITRAKLDALAPGRKVILTGFTGHTTILSTPAMAALGLSLDAKDPSGGWFGRDADGKLNGRANEYAEYALWRRFSDLATEDDLTGDIQTFSEQALRYGITSVQAMPFGSEERYAKALAKANVPLRVRVIDFHIPGTTPVWKGGGAIKWILDGTPIEQGAALRTAKYKDGSQGRENFTDVAPLVQTAVDNKLQLLFHASGDKTVATALNAFAKASLQRPRIEHGDGLQPDLFPLAKQTGAIVVLNPTHFPFSDAYPRGDYMLASSIAKAGIPIAIGSDGELNPYLNILMASSRRDRPSESLSRIDALRAYTSGSAFAELAETKKGKIAPGMLADIAILSQNILDAAAQSLPETQSVVTIIDGKVVYQQ